MVDRDAPSLVSIREVSATVPPEPVFVAEVAFGRA